MAGPTHTAIDSVPSGLVAAQSCVLSWAATGANRPTAAPGIERGGGEGGDGDGGDDDEEGGVPAGGLGAGGRRPGLRLRARAAGPQAAARVRLLRALPAVARHHLRLHPPLLRQQRLLPVRAPRCRANTTSSGSPPTSAIEEQPNPPSGRLVFAISFRMMRDLTRSFFFLLLRVQLGAAPVVHDP